MAISQDLFLAILAMDTYNRGYNAGINLPSSAAGGIGNATLGASSNINEGSPERSASFFAQAYTLANGKTVISYRGTDVLPGVTDPLFSAGSRSDAVGRAVSEGASP